ncbi:MULTISPECIES: hypothetical protein [unclassified Exiguobacterium]|nr:MULTISPECIES: hypothetical protein [unclassified Exiguobacterium]TCI43506.1 hypothetical protein EVJ31_11580 [Exiguobacterium sp. SH5S32]TCI52796.1 hypothetical protein EVJ25_06775 [Exiguobacterium sp. SH1S4]TCI65896.1 hypothetical protein EVJ21_01110 [Exiguobacterium sp. SH0S2]TCI81052.1 hypothetical protein EVJ20_03310 [Exiguobacterium sp. SH0S1]TCI35697.1 hypothetical protein EVJ29_09575 [Exiguobacterium sp. SH4S7]
MSTKSLTLIFISVYILMSLPAMLGIGYVIDWIPETTLLEKIKGHVIEGLVNNYLFKMVVSGVVSVYSHSHFYIGCER